MAKLAKLLPLVRGSGPEDRNQAKVLDAALLAFLDFGIKRTSMVEVARRGGLSLATLYRRYAGKNDLIQAVGLRQARQLVEEIDAQVREPIERDASAEEQITVLFIAFTEGLRGNQLLDRLLKTEPEIVLPYLTVQGAPVIELGRDYLAEFIARLQAEGKLPQYDPLPLAEMIARAALSLALTPQTVIPLDDPVALRRFARDHIIPGFRIL
ncbi:TetR/AcrR family transcriptional regulator [Nocardia seriolae]|uniref:TetR/AcrR family transcriptional regulator n=1 Tax=Nocardia seriolae TaxID=37332 RepID=UPI0008FF2A1A|nr:TetR/AcrR family transcriptional regulator [Nocardia seriolae]OJF82630.1 TetR family transcriptional regulator [Nocardia seriolae]PSK29838.1 TetR/AcrR family transcriptional regulator [Nocardia seriolae]QOW33382.1 TetR/AcrR family transcriptional regulator [Nocardia seriolae]QUN20870.1 TetR/AcrR family transcriptional regulator [Nocardia seriolae]WNJ60403.1 TetR/AcrR family transcriptional regulator [Nocardia seriolae]